MGHRCDRRKVVRIRGLFELAWGLKKERLGHIDMKRILGMMVLGSGLVLGGVAGCDAEEPGDESEFRGATKKGSIWSCQTCEFRNSPAVGLEPIGTATINDPFGSDMNLVGIRDWSGNQLDVDIIQGAIIADPQGAAAMGSALVGFELVFENAAKTQLFVEIANYKKVADWTPAQQGVDTYALAYFDPTTGEGPFNVCPGLDLDHTSTLIIRDETYNDDATVNPGKTDYATFACRGHAIAKMKLLGKAPNDGYGSDWEDRQATLKMITADYCGIGESFTVAGTHLFLHDEDKINPQDGSEDPNRIEAKWDMNGAICLNTPRAVTVAEVKNHCALPPACDTDLDDYLGGHWITVLP